MTTAPIQKPRLPVLTVLLAVGAICLRASAIWVAFATDLPISAPSRDRTLARLIPPQALTLAKGGFLTLTGALVLFRKSPAVLAAALMTGITGVQFLWHLDQFHYGRVMPNGAMPIFVGYWMLAVFLCLAFTLYLRRLAKTGVLK